MLKRTVHKSAVEQLCVLQVDRLLSPRGHRAAYLGPNDRLDFAVLDRDGNRVGVGEITRDCDPELAQYQSLIHGRNQVLPMPPGTGRWLAAVHSPVDIRSLPAVVNRLVPYARPGFDGRVLLEADWNTPPAGELAEAGIDSLHAVDGECDELLVFGPMFGGQIDGDAELPARYAADALQQPSVARRVQKLASAVAALQHLVLVPDQPVEHYSVTWRMNGWGSWPGLPTQPPKLPEHITDLWLVQPVIGHTIHWSERSGWERGEPQGARWWHDRADTPELQALKEYLEP